MLYLTMRDRLGFVRQAEKYDLAALCAAVVGIAYRAKSS